MSFFFFKWNRAELKRKQNVSEAAIYIFGFSFLFGIYTHTSSVTMYNKFLNFYLNEIRKFSKPLELLVGRERDRGQGKINDFSNRTKEKMRV